jgi:hypothetical protein
MKGIAQEAEVYNHVFRALRFFENEERLCFKGEAAMGFELRRHSLLGLFYAREQEPADVEIEAESLWARFI